MNFKTFSGTESSYNLLLSCHTASALSKGEGHNMDVIGE
jgi:hypothetical protein